MRSVLGGGMVVCLLNPDLGREGETETRAPRQRQVLVVNGGPVGIEAARVAALRGHYVRLWDERTRLDGRWSWLLKPYILNRLNMLAELGVKVELGKAITREAVSAEKPEVVIVGRGLRAPGYSIPGMESVQPIQANDILEGNAEVNGNIVILGGGNIGFQVADLLVRQKCQVLVIEEGPVLGDGVEPFTRNVLRRRLVEQGVAFYRRARVIQVEAGIVAFVDERGAEQRLPLDYLVLAQNWEPSEELLESLQGADYQLIPVGPYQQPELYARAFKEGTSIGRTI